MDELEWDAGGASRNARNDGRGVWAAVSGGGQEESKVSQESSEEAGETLAKGRKETTESVKERAKETEEALKRFGKEGKCIAAVESRAC